MSNIIDIYNSKFVQEKTVDNNNFYSNLEEVEQENSSQKRHISSVNYNTPSNFARFGSAEEYYKNAINYIDSNYPYSAGTADKLKWINGLNDFEYHIYNNEYPRSLGYCSLSGTQYINVNSHIKNPTEDIKDSYDAGYKYNSNRTLSLDDGITFESWLNFNSDDYSRILSITALTSSDPYINNPIPFLVFSIARDTSGPTPQFVLSEESYGSGYYTFQTSIPRDEWHHYSFVIKSDSAKLFVDGQLVEELKDISLLTSQKFVFAPGGLIFLDTSQTAAFESVDWFVFKIGTGNFSLDETRFWNTARSIEKVGRYWLTNVDGNDFSNPNNSNLLFYYKFNEGWDSQYQFLCLDYSGYDNDGEIIDYTEDCRISGSAINNSGLIRSLEIGDPVYKGLSYSTTVKDYYANKIAYAISHDENNIHLLYNKLPSWVIEDEEANETKHLKQLIQVVSYYFDDLYNKIQEITNYKTIKHGQAADKIYPFYDKILSSTGFDFTDLFTNLDIIEKISSRNDKDIFDGDIDKVKNFIFQNIYNNLSYILKSKGTEKSIKSLLHSYGISDELVKINLYADNAEYNIADRSKETVVKKKTVSVTGENIVFLSASSISENSDLYQYTLEVCATFPISLANSYVTSSLFGIINNSSSIDTATSTNAYEYSVMIENDTIYGSRFVFIDNTNTTASSYYQDFYDNSAWNLAIRKKLNIDTMYGTSSLPTATYELYGINTNGVSTREFSCSLPPISHTDGYLRHYVGAKKQDLSGSLLYNTASKFLYCNFWTDYLNNDTIISHNKDILNYGVDE